MTDNKLPSPTQPKVSTQQLGGQAPLGGGTTPIKPPPTTLVPSMPSKVNIPTPTTGPASVPPPSVGQVSVPDSGAASPLGAPDKTVVAPTPDQLSKIAQQADAGSDPQDSVKGSGMSGKKEVPKIIQPGGRRPLFASFTGGKLKKFLPFIIGGGVLLLILIVFGLIRAFGGSSNSSVSVDQAMPADNGTQQVAQQPAAPTKQVVLTYWGLWENDTIIAPVLRKFEEQNPGVLVKYVKQSPKDYRERLQTAIASGQGPDLFRFHASWVPMLADDLASMPNSVMSSANYRQSFYPIASEQLQQDGQIVGVPLMYDGLMLYYNEDIFNTAGVQPPKTWAELKELATKLTIEEGGQIKRAGVALGNASNVEHFSDVIGLLMIQNGADFTKPTSKAAQDALTFYTNFVKTDKVWSDKLPSSTAAFARGDVAMMFAPSWRAHDVLAINPDLKFQMVQPPRLADKDVAWATYWAEGVNSKSKNKDYAWALIKYLSSSDVMKTLYSNQSQVRAFGEPYSLVSLSSLLSSDPYVAPVLAGANVAESWYLNSYTHDNGINDQIIKYYTDAVNAILTGSKAEEVMVTVEKGTTQVLRQYGVN